MKSEQETNRESVGSRDSATPPDFYRFATKAMATEFTLLFPSDGEHDIDYLSRAATECFCELDRIEAELSRYKPNSDIARINRLLPGEVIRVGMATIDCLGLALAVADETSGAFDVTVGSLMDAYRNRDGSERIPGSEELRRAGKVTGGNLFEVDRGRLAVKVLGEGVSLDLGGVGKGYALDQMGGVLENWSIFDALLNAGDSTVLALGAPSGETRQGWPVRAEGVSENEGILMLSNYSLSGSGFLEKGAHIIDPRSRKPARLKRLRTWASAPTAAMADALSTAFSLMTKKEILALCRRHPQVRALFWEA